MGNKKVYLTADDFLAGITVEPEDFDAPGLGLVQLRALTTVEVQRLQSKFKGDETSMFVGAIMEGMVYPKLSADAMERLQQGAFGKILPVAKRIMALSGMAGSDEEAENLEQPPGDGS